jgi:hypothetical protein
LHGESIYNAQQNPSLIGAISDSAIILYKDLDELSHKIAARKDLTNQRNQ